MLGSETTLFYINKVGEGFAMSIFFTDFLLNCLFRHLIQLDNSVLEALLLKIFSVNR